MNEDNQVTGDTHQHNSLSLKAALVILVLVSLLLVTFSYWLYTRSPNYKYDLARPGDKKTIATDQEDAIDEGNAPIDSQAVKDTEKLINEHLEDLEAIDDFSPEPLSKKSLFLD